ncbi:hypothetical protein Tco_1022090, partial [Tanacetum coccineum]
QWVPAAGDGNGGCMVDVMGWVATGVGVSCDDGDGIASGGEDGVDGEMVVAIVGTSPENYSGGRSRWAAPEKYGRGEGIVFKVFVCV